MNLRALLTAVWLLVVAVVYLALYLICQYAHSRLSAALTDGGGGKGRRRKCTLTSSSSSADLMDDVEIGSGLWMVVDDSDSGSSGSSEDESELDMIEGELV
jgi:hypothetical protein